MVWGKGKPKGRSGAGDEFKNILIPSNCSYLKTPYLHLEIHRAKGKRAYVKATIPLNQGVVNLRAIEKKAKKELSKLRDISPLLHQSIRMQNVLFTETQRKRKYDICSTLRKHFRCYFSCPSTENRLFDEPTITKMRQNLKHSVEKRQ